MHLLETTPLSETVTIKVLKMFGAILWAVKTHEHLSLIHLNIQCSITILNNTHDPSIWLDCKIDYASNSDSDHLYNIIVLISDKCCKLFIRHQSLALSCNHVATMICCMLALYIIVRRCDIWFSMFCRFTVLFYFSIYYTIALYFKAYSFSARPTIVWCWLLG